MLAANAMGAIALYARSGTSDKPGNKKKNILIEFVDSNFEREPLIRPFGFKGGALTELWQVASCVGSSSGIKKVGLGTQSILWSDASVFSSNSESGGNSLMFSLTNFALKLLKGAKFNNPIELQEQILSEVYRYGIEITGNRNLRETFVLNALVPVDNALWMLYAAENGFSTFDDMIPEEYRMSLSQRQSEVASIPLVSYGVPVTEIINMVKSGYYFMKIKIGQPGTQEEMLAKDMERISAIHKAIGHYRTPHTVSGKIPYYFDANGRYEEKETLLKLISHLEKIGALDQVAILEEPFPEEVDITVEDIPLRIAADESAHTDKDTLKRIQMGYKAVALKPIAKTMSMTMKIAKAAKEKDIPCFCADLTVNPILVDWNKNFAARLDAFPGLGTGLLESNGSQNYKNWSVMETYHAFPDAEWRKTKKGMFNLDKDFYKKSGGILADSPHYMKMFDI